MSDVLERGDWIQRISEPKIWCSRCDIIGLLWSVVLHEIERNMWVFWFFIMHSIWYGYTRPQVSWGIRLRKLHQLEQMSRLVFHGAEYMAWIHQISVVIVSQTEKIRLTIVIKNSYSSWVFWLWQVGLFYCWKTVVMTGVTVIKIRYQKKVRLVN